MSDTGLLSPAGTKCITPASSNHPHHDLSLMLSGMRQWFVSWGEHVCIDTIPEP
jgi:hypothetical protein